MSLVQDPNRGVLGLRSYGQLIPGRLVDFSTAAVATGSFDEPLSSQSRRASHATTTLHDITTVKPVTGLQVLPEHQEVLWDKYHNTSAD